MSDRICSLRKSARLMPFLRFYATLSPSEGISIPPTSLSGLAKEVKRRTKVVEVFCDEGISWMRHGERASSEDLQKSR